MSILSLYISLGKRGQNGRAGLGSNLANRGQKIQERWVHSLAWIQMLSYLDETICAFQLSVGFFFFFTWRICILNDFEFAFYRCNIYLKINYCIMCMFAFTIAVLSSMWHLPSCVCLQFLETGSELGSHYNEVIAPQDVATYGGLCALASFDRAELKVSILFLHLFLFPFSSFYNYCFSRSS